MKDTVKNFATMQQAKRAARRYIKTCLCCGFGIQVYMHPEMISVCAYREREQINARRHLFVKVTP